MALLGETMVTNLDLFEEQTEAMQQEESVIFELLPAESGNYVTLDLLDLDVNIMDAICGLVQEENNGVNPFLEHVEANPILEEGNGVNLQKFILDTNDLTLGQESDGSLPVSSPDTDNLSMDEGYFSSQYVSPAEVCGGKVKSKRGRKRKYPEGQRPRRSRAQKKPKVYELKPMQDPVMEKKRLYALNAKKHRDMQKKEKEDLQNQLRKITEERDQLMQMVETLKRRESTIQEELDTFRAITIDSFKTPELL